MRSSAPAEMSLSRRLLALPQELWGASLPPQVSGQRHGCVTLCVPHILESAVSSRPLPREALVRVRWWGEQAPGSLFRPRLLRDGGAHAHTQTHRAVAMKYPVNAEPEQLAEYFQDMRQLALDVIDRDSRKQVGQCTLSLELQRDNAVVTAEEKLAALSRDNALCEIRPSEGEQDEVLGYLAVSFDVQWTDETKLRSREQVEEVGEQVSSASSTSLPSRREWTPVVGVKEERQVVPVDAVLDEQEENVETADSRRSGGDFQRIQRLLVKGKALQQSMERAVKDKEGGGGEEVDVVVGAEAGGYLNAADELQKRRGLDAYSEVTSFTGEVDEHQLQSPVSKLDKERSVTAQLNDEIDPDFLNQINAFKLTFESLEFSRDFVDHQLRQLRDSSSVSSRFSPIEIRVSHNDVASLLFQQANEAAVPEISAFSVTTSLRRRQWQLECSSTMPLTPSSSSFSGIDRRTKLDKPVPNDRSGMKQLHFFARCENQSDARRNRKKEENKHIPRPSKCVLLTGALPVTALFDKERDKHNWKTTIPLFFVGDDSELDTTNSFRGNYRGTRVDRVPRNKKIPPVGYLKVKCEFCDLSPSNSSSENGSASEANDGGIDVDLSSISSSLSEENLRQKHLASRRRGFGPSNPVSTPTIPRELHYQMQHQLRGNDYIAEFASSKLFQLGVMIDGVSSVKLVEPSVSLSPSKRESKTVRNGGNIGSDVTSTEAPSISLHYSVPSVFTRKLQPSIKFERTARRKLRSSRWSDATSSLSADFIGSIHVFQSIFADDASEYFSDGYLIIEAWLHTEGAKSTLLGLSKVPLSNFAAFFRNDEVGLLGYSKQILPIASVDGKFAIENPFTGYVAGYLQVRTCVGTAEQLLLWAATVKAIIKLQSIVRGALSRTQLSRPGYDVARQNSSTHITGETMVSLSVEDSRSDSQSTTPTVPATARVIGSNDKCIEADISEQRIENCLNDSDLAEGDTRGSEHRMGLRKIRFDVRECWRSALQQSVRVGDHPQHRGWRSAPLLGCELQGQLVLSGSAETAGRQKGMGLPFALWWDAADTSLNSSFAHSFGARGSHLKASPEDMPAIGRQSQVLFALHVENGFFGTQSRETIMGEARLNLYKAFGKRLHHSAAEPSSVNVDIPIEWDGGNDEFLRLPTALPLRISYHAASYLLAHEQVIDPSGDVFSGCFGSFENWGDKTSSALAEKRLLPPITAISPRLCDDFGHSDIPASDCGQLTVLCAGGEEDSVSDESHPGDSQSGSAEIQCGQSSDDVKSGEFEKSSVSEDDHDSTALCAVDGAASESSDSSIETEETPGDDMEDEHSVNYSGNTGNSGDVFGDAYGTELRSDSESLQEDDEDEVVAPTNPNGGIALLNVTSADIAETIPTDHSEIDEAALPETTSGSVSDESHPGDSQSGSAEIQCGQSSDDVKSGEALLNVTSADIAETIPTDHSEIDEAALPETTSEESTAVNVDFVTVVPTGNVAICQEDPLNIGDAAATVCAESSIVEAGVGDDMNNARLSVKTISCNPCRAIEYADKAVQVDLCDLTAQTEVVSEALQGFTVNEIFSGEPIDSEGESNARGEKRTVDVGCDAMDIASGLISDSIACQEASHALQSTELEIDDKRDESKIDVPEINWESDAADHLVGSPNSLYDKQTGDNVPSSNPPTGNPEQQITDRIVRESEPSTLQNDKLELVYGMLCEMRDAYLAKPSERLSNGITLKAVVASHENEAEGDKRCSCPSPAASVDPVSPKTSLTLDGSIARGLLSPNGARQQDFTHISKMRSPPQLSKQNLTSKTTGLDNASAPNALRSSFSSTGRMTQYQVGADAVRLSSSVPWGSQARYNRHTAEENGHSSVHSLLAHDSETERIARIMQGSMNYWMKDDSSSSCDDEGSNEEETDDDCYF